MFKRPYFSIFEKKKYNYQYQIKMLETTQLCINYLHQIGILYIM